MRIVPPPEGEPIPSVPGAVSLEQLGRAPHGDLSDIAHALDITATSTLRLMSSLAIDKDYIPIVQNGIDRARYRVVGGDSVATYLEATFQGNLQDQLAEARGAHTVKVHLGVFEILKDAASRVYPETDVDPREMTWVWEIGRYAGKLIHREACPPQAVPVVPPLFGMHNFFQKFAEDISASVDEDFRSKTAIPDQPAPSAIRDYYEFGQPERFASAMGNCFLESFQRVSPEFISVLNEKLRKQVLREYASAQEFHNDFRPELSYRELAATHPFDEVEFHNYLEYISSVEDDTMDAS